MRKDGGEEMTTKQKVSQQAPTTHLVQEPTLKRSWESVLKNILKDDVRMSFGDPNTPKQALDSCQLVILSGEALTDITERKVPKTYQLGGNRLIGYEYEFTREYVENLTSLPEIEQPEYSYMQRLIEPFDQLDTMKKTLRGEYRHWIRSNRCQATTWRNGDTLRKSPPCLQRIQAMYIEEPEGVVLCYDWRSRDAFGAWPVNIIAITNMMIREVLRPNHLKLLKVRDYSTSLHIYDYNVDEAWNAIGGKPVKYEEMWK
jgi:hypothetical protein